MGILVYETDTLTKVITIIIHIYSAVYLEGTRMPEVCVCLSLCVYVGSPFVNAM